MWQGVATVLVGFAAGSLASSLGIGGGLVFVPALAVIFSFSQHLAQGTSLAVIVPTVLVGAVTHARAGRVDFKLAAAIGCGGVAGGLLGGWLAQDIDETLLRRLFSVLLLITAMRMLLRSRPSVVEGDGSGTEDPSAGGSVSGLDQPAVGQVGEAGGFPEESRRSRDPLDGEPTEG